MCRCGVLAFEGDQVTSGLAVVVVTVDAVINNFVRPRSTTPPPPINNFARPQSTILRAPN